MLLLRYLRVFSRALNAFQMPRGKEFQQRLVVPVYGTAVVDFNGYLGISCLLAPDRPLPNRAKSPSSP